MSTNTNSALDIKSILLVYARYWLEKKYDQALKTIDAVLSVYPNDMTFFWYRCCCLEQLNKHTQVLLDIEQQMEKLDEHQQKLDDLYEQTGDESLYESEHIKQQLNDQRIFLLTVKNMPADICKQFIHLDLNEQKILVLYDRLIELEPDCAQWYENRAGLYLSLAYLDEEQQEIQSTDAIHDFSGTGYSISQLEKALADYQQASELDTQEYRYFISLAKVLHLLQRYDEAMAAYDQVLALIPENHPARPFILERRQASEHNGQGEHNQMANLIMSSLGDIAKKNRTIEEDMAYSMVKSMEEAIRSGQSFEQAAELISDSPEDIMALNIARNILNVALEPALQLEQIDIHTFPAYHKQYIHQLKKQLKAFGYQHLGDAEAQNLTAMIGQRIALGIFVSEDGYTSIHGCTIKPKWPGVLTFLILLLTGKWRKYKVMEMGTLFDNGHFIHTRRTDAPDHFGKGPFIHFENMPANTPLKKLVGRHEYKCRKFLQKCPQAKKIPLQSFSDIEKASQEEAKVRNAYRQSIHYVTDEELHSLLGKNYDRFADKVRTKLAHLVQLQQ